MFVLNKVFFLRFILCEVLFNSEILLESIFIIDFEDGNGFLFFFVFIKLFRILVIVMIFFKRGF